MTRRSEIAFWLFLLGIVSVLFGLRWVLFWEQLVPALRGYAVVVLAGGAVLALAGLALWRRRWTAPARWVGAAAATVCGAAVLAGSLTGTIPCAGPG